MTTAEGKVIHKKLASKPLKFQPSMKSEETRKPTNGRRRCGTLAMITFVKPSTTHVGKCKKNLPTGRGQYKLLLPQNTDKGT